VQDQSHLDGYKSVTELGLKLRFLEPELSSAPSAVALCALGVAFPMLESLRLSSEDDISIRPLYGLSMLRYLRSLWLQRIDPSSGDLRNVLPGLGNMCSLRIHHNGYFLRPPAVGVLPDSLERLHLETTECRHDSEQFNQLLRVIGALPNLMELVIDDQYLDCDAEVVDWLGLLPVASRLVKLKLNFQAYDRGNFCELLLEMKDLKSLDLMDFDNTEALLRNISLLTSLESLKIRSTSQVSLESRTNFERLFNGPVGRSLTSCRLRFDIADEQVAESLIQYFKEQVESLFQMRDMRALELVLRSTATRAIRSSRRSSPFREARLFGGEDGFIREIL